MTTRTKTRLPEPPRAITTGPQELARNRWQACAIDPKAFGGMYDGGYRETCVEGGIAFVYVCGPLDHHQSWWLDSYDSIVCRIEYALADPDAKAVVICFDSPGGDASGVEEAHRKIKAMRAQYGKPVFAYANESCYSAAYWLACAADGIWLPPTGGVGSVGVIAEVYDVTGANEKLGVRVELVTTGKQKADGHPERPLTDEILARVQDRVNKIGAVFFASVAEARDMDPDDVEGLQAACLLGTDAKAAGLADDVISYDEFLADVSAQFDTGKNRAKTEEAIMKPTEKTLQAAVDAAQTALAAAKTPEEKSQCEKTLAAALDAKVKYSKRTRTDELEEDDGDDDGDDDDDDGDDDDDDDAPPSSKPGKKSKKSDSEDDGDDAEDEEADEDAEDEEADEDAEEESEEEASANATRTLASLSEPKRGAAKVERLFRAVAKLTKRTKLSEQLGALDALVGRLESAKAMESRIARLESKGRSDRVKTMIERASAQGKIVAGSPQAKSLTEQGLKDPSWLKGHLASLPKVVRTVSEGTIKPRENAAPPDLAVETMSAAQREMYESFARSAGVTLDKYLETARDVARKMSATTRPTH